MVSNPVRSSSVVSALLPLALILALLPAIPARAQDAQGATTITVRGRIEGPNGPVAGARVAALTVPSHEDIAGCNTALERPGGSSAPTYYSTNAYCPCLRAAKKILGKRYGETLAETLTDADGRFALPPLPKAASWWVYVQSGELRALAYPREAEDFVVEASPPAARRVRLVDSDGKPIADATVVPVPALPGLRQVRSDAHGEVALESVHYSLVTKDGHPPLLLAYNRNPAQSSGKAAAEPPVILFPRSTTLEGRVSLDGKPAAGAKVSVTDSDCGAGETTTDTQGRFSLKALSLPYTLSALLGGWVDLEILQLPLRPVELKLVQGGFVDATVTDAHGKPVPDALVAVGQTEARTDAQGRHRFGPFLRTMYPVRVLELPVAGSAPSTRVDLQPGENRADIKLQPTARLEGTVLDESGVPVAGAEVWANPEAATSPSQKCTTSTDAAGRFSCGERSQGRYFVSIAHPEIARHWSTPVEHASSQPLRIGVPRGAVVSGTLVDAKGAPIAKAQLKLRAAHPNALGVPQVRIYPGFSNEPRTMGAETDSGGRFTFGRVLPGEYLVMATWGDESPETRAMKRFDAAGGTVSVSLAPGRGEPIAGRVQVIKTTDDRRPWSTGDAHVLAYVKGTKESAAETVTTGDGRFLLHLPRPGSYELVVRKSNLLLPAPLVARTGSTDLEVKAVPAVPVTGKVLLPDGAPAKRFTVNGELQESADGSFVLTAAGGRVLAVKIEAEGCAPFEYRLAVGQNMSFKQLPVGLPAFRLSAKGSAAKVKPSPSAVQRDLAALAAFGEVPPCMEGRPNPKYPGEGQRNARLYGVPIEPLAALRGQTPRVLPFLESPWEPVLRRAVDVLCSIQDDEARQAIVELSRRYPCRSWLCEALRLSGSGACAPCPKTLGFAGSELRDALEQDLASWMNEESRARARRISETPDQLLLEAVREQAAVDLGRRTRALAALAAIDSKPALLQLVRELANGFEATSYPGKDIGPSFVRAPGLIVAALRSTAAAQGTSPAKLVFELSRELNSIESEWLAGMAISDPEIMTELRKLTRSPQAAELQEPGARALVAFMKQIHSHEAQ